MSKIYLAGPFGFYRFNGMLACYGSYKLVSDDGPPEQRGFHLLNKLKISIEKLGSKVFNPWFDTLHPSYFSGVVFGMGLDENNDLWQLGSLRKQTLAPIIFDKWINKLNAQLSEERKILLSAHQDYPLASNIYEKEVRRLIYDRCIEAAASADLVFADFNSYKGSIDIGTFMEADRAISSGKRVIVLLDESAQVGEGDSPLPLMVDGWIQDNHILVTNNLDTFLLYLQNGQNIHKLSLHSAFKNY